jgi:hypothetical protein
VAHETKTPSHGRRIGTSMLSLSMIRPIDKMATDALDVGTHDSDGRSDLFVQAI